MQPEYGGRRMYSHDPMSPPFSNANTNITLSWRRLYLSRAKLKASSRTSGLLSGFAMVAMVEISIDDNQASPIPESLLILFAVCTTLLVTVHLMALMISTCILPNIEAASSLKDTNEAVVNESPHDQMKLCVDIAWICSTGLGIILFLAELAILCWVKFYTISQKAAIAATTIVIPAGLVFIVFALMFYKKLVAHKSQRHSEGLRELDEMARELDNTGDGMAII